MSKAQLPEIGSLEDTKLMRVLEHFLSIHEADEIYNAIFNSPDVTPEDVETMLKFYKISGKVNKDSG